MWVLLNFIFKFRIYFKKFNKFPIFFDEIYIVINKNAIDICFCSCKDGFSKDDLIIEHYRYCNEDTFRLVNKIIAFTGKMEVIYISKKF